MVGAAMQQGATDGVRAWSEGPVARVAMARPEKRNAQEERMLHALDAAFAAAAADDDARFSDPVVAMGVNGHEWFVHPWELGARKAKELLFTGEAIGAEEALRLGMVNHVVARDELESFTLDLAQRVARQDPLALKLAKRSVNHALDAQGQAQAIEHAFALHHFAHER